MLALHATTDTLLLTARTTTHAPEFDEKRLQTAMEGLQRWVIKNAGHQTEKRRAPRYDFFNPAVLCIPPQTGSVPLNEAPSPRLSFPVFPRNLSKSGVSFLVAAEMLPRVIDDHTEPLRGDNVIRVGNQVLVGLPQSDGTLLWLDSRIIRKRTILEGFVEVGTQFVVKYDGLPF